MKKCEKSFSTKQPLQFFHKAGIINTERYEETVENYLPCGGLVLPVFTLYPIANSFFKNDLAAVKPRFIGLDNFPLKNSV